MGPHVMAGKAYKAVQQKSDLTSAVEGAFAEVESLASEMSEWRDSLEESFSHTEKYSQVSEAADLLESATDPSLDLPQADVVWTEYVPRRKRRNPSRASRLGNATSALNASVEVLRGLSEEEGITEEQSQEYNEFAEEIEGLAGELELVEFPGMFG